MDTLFYDGQCPLCRREIATLRRLQDGGLEFADIHEQVETATLHPSREMLLRRLHLRSNNGAWVTGLRANVRAWSHTRYGFFFRPLLWPGLFFIATSVYERWADRRYAKRYACEICKPG